MSGASTVGISISNRFFRNSISISFLTLRTNSLSLSLSLSLFLLSIYLFFIPSLWSSPASFPLFQFPSRDTCTIAGILSHHDAVTGTSPRRTIADYLSMTSHATKQVCFLFDCELLLFLFSFAFLFFLFFV